MEIFFQGPEIDFCFEEETHTHTHRQGHTHTGSECEGLIGEPTKSRR